MKKIASALTILLLTIFGTSVIIAQTPSATPVNNIYATAYQDYLNKGGVYQSTYNDYLVARSAYLASQSLDSKDKTMTATLKMLQARDDVMTSYLNAIKIKLQITQGVSPSDVSSLGSQLDAEISYYAGHRTKLTSAGSLDDLVNDSSQAQSQYDSSTLLVIYLSVIDLGAGNNNAIRQELNNEITLLQAKITQIKSNQDKDVSIEERSLVDVQNKIVRSQGKDQDANNLILGIKSSDQNKSNAFQDAESDLTNSNLYLQEATQGLLQIITQIKTAY